MYSILFLIPYIKFWLSFWVFFSLMDGHDTTYTAYTADTCVFYQTIERTRINFDPTGCVILG
jgi:hypothetical protein